MNLVTAMDKKYMSYNNLINYDDKLKDYISILLSDFLGKVYPIGSIYLSISSVSPVTLFGGIWEQIQDTFLLAAGNLYSAGSTGGESEHILTVDEMPKHNHMLKTDINNPDYDVTWSEWFEYTTGWTQEAGVTESPATHTTKTGGDMPHNNMPPYLTVYMWKRIG